MKKFISLLASAAMIFSVASTLALADTMPTISVEIGEYDEDYEGYPITVKASDLPELSSTATTNKASGTKIAMFEVQLVPSKTVEYIDGDVCVGTNGSGVLANGNVSVSGVSSDCKSAYPNTKVSGITEVDLGTVYVSADPGTSFTISDSFISVYPYTSGTPGTENKITSFNIPVPTATIPGGSDPATLGLTADLINKYDNGYIWNANVTKGENEISSFGVEFSAGGDTKTGSIANISALTNKYTGAEFTFQVGLKTTKTLDSATFSIADGGDPITADAPVSK